MPKVNSQTKKSPSRKMSAVAEQITYIDNETMSNQIFNKKFLIIAVIIGLVLLAFYKKNWFVAATVNGQPITNFELLTREDAQYRSQTLNQMINEKIIKDEARKKGVVVTKGDVDSKISELEKNVGGSQALDSLLAQQGQTRQSLKDQLTIQLIVEKLYANQATVSASEVDKFITDNKDQLQSSDSATQRKEAESSLKQQKLSQIFNDKFQALKQAANIKIF